MGHYGVPNAYFSWHLLLSAKNINLPYRLSQGSRLVVFSVLRGLFTPVNSASRQRFTCNSVSVMKSLVGYGKHPCHLLVSDKIIGIGDCQSTSAPGLWVSLAMDPRAG
jgi:hypothetical protein